MQNSVFLDKIVIYVLTFLKVSLFKQYNNNIGYIMVKFKPSTFAREWGRGQTIFQPDELNVTFHKF